MDPDFTLIQARLSHEDDLVNQRVSWLVNSQSFLLTAYAITLNGSGCGREQTFGDRSAEVAEYVAGRRRRVRAAGLRGAGRRPLCDRRTQAFRRHEICERSALSHFQTDHPISRSQRAGLDSSRFSGDLVSRFILTQGGRAKLRLSRGFPVASPYDVDPHQSVVRRICRGSRHKAG